MGHGGFRCGRCRTVAEVPEVREPLGLPAVGLVPAQQRLKTAMPIASPDPASCMDPLPQVPPRIADVGVGAAGGRAVGHVDRCGCAVVVPGDERDLAGAGLAGDSHGQVVELPDPGGVDVIINRPPAPCVRSLFWLSSVTTEAFVWP